MGRLTPVGVAGRRGLDCWMGAWLLLAGGLGSALAAGEPARQALVIGNGAYTQAAPLPNPVADARAIAAKLRELGFAVQHHSDLTQPGLLDALDRFGRAAAGAEVILVYFAGHGIQVDGENYLLGVEADLRDRRDLRRALPLTAVLDEASRADTLGLVILDACRDNPFVVRLAEATGRSLLGRGLARVGAPAPNLLIAYATRDGAIAEDGKAGEHSPYARALLTHLGEPVEVGLLLRRVRDSVMRQTAERQQPMTYGSLGAQPIYLAGSSSAFLPVEAGSARPDAGISGVSWPTPAVWVVVALVGLGLPLGLAVGRRRPARALAVPAVGDSGYTQSAHPVQHAAPALPRYRLRDLGAGALGFTFPVADDAGGASLVLGSDAGADWRILLDTVSRRHARLFWRTGSWWIEDLDSSNGTAVNQVRLAPRCPHRLQPDDLIGFGAHGMRFEGPRADTPPSDGVVSDRTAGDPAVVMRPQRCRLIDPANPTLGYALPALGRGRGASVVIGREAPADWLIPLDTLSRQHARVFLRDAAWWIEDLGSSNGTRLNGVRLPPHQPSRLAAHDRLSLGALELRLDCSPRAPVKASG